MFRPLGHMSVYIRIICEDSTLAVVIDLAFLIDNSAEVDFSFLADRFSIPHGLAWNLCVLNIVTFIVTYFHVWKPI